MEEDDDDLLLACSMIEENSAFPPRSAKKKPAQVQSSFKSQDSWIASSFGDFGGDFAKKSVPKSNPGKDSGKQPRKRTKFTDVNSSAFQQLSSTSEHIPVKSRSQLSSGDLWADKYQPNCQADLAVHKKKIAELEDWLRHSLKQQHKLSPLLLLTGPSGAGKTATLRVLAKELSIEIQEWTNPITEMFDSSDDWKTDSGNFRPVGGPVYVSQTAQFQDFLLRANRYPSLQIFNQDQLRKKIILVEEFPNVFFKNTSQFHDILRSYQLRGHGPLVFIVSDSAGGDSNERLLFPKQLQEELCVANISFNPIAPTSLGKILTKLATEEASCTGGRYLVPSKATIDALCAASAGDIRGAINALQFACLTDTRDLDELMVGSSHSSTSKKPGSRPSNKRGQTSARARRPPKKKSADLGSDLAAIGGRDTSLFLFRALGKILYCKRGDPSDYPDSPVLPRHLSQHHRDPLLIQPEDVVEKAQLSGEYFTAYLHQNYLDFYGTLDDVVMATDYLSDADHLTTDWTNRSALREYAASIAARSLMFCNTSRAHSSGGGPSGLGWKPLHKPQWYDINKKRRRNKEASRELFVGNRLTPEELHMNVLPYMTMVKVKLQGPGQMSFVQEFNKFDNRLYQRGYSQRLDENDLVDVDSDNDVDAPSSHLKASQGQSLTDDQDIVMPEEDDDLIIEEFDD